MNICILGCGSIGSVLARAVDEMQEIGTIYLLDRSLDRSTGLAKIIASGEEVSDLDSILDDVNLVIEAASQKAVQSFGLNVVQSGTDLMIMSVGALMDDDLYGKLVSAASKSGACIHIPSGAIGGLDVVNVASHGSISELSLRTSKPPQGLKNIDFIEAAGIDVEKIERPTVVFDGNAMEAIKKFPLNINVASILALAGPGKERTRVRIIVDPDQERNTHEVTINGDFGDMKCTVRNRPHPENPKTSYLAALSAIGMVKRIVGVVKIGT